jgi:hypothetical protein
MEPSPIDSLNSTDRTQFIKYVRGKISYSSQLPATKRDVTLQPEDENIQIWYKTWYASLFPSSTTSCLSFFEKKGHLGVWHPTFNSSKYSNISWVHLSQPGPLTRGQHGEKLVLISNPVRQQASCVDSAPFPGGKATLRPRLLRIVGKGLG